MKKKYGLKSSCKIFFLLDFLFLSLCISLSLFLFLSLSSLFCISFLSRALSYAHLSQNDQVLSDSACVFDILRLSQHLVVVNTVFQKNIQLRPGRTKLRGRPYYYVGAGVRCIDLCYHNHCFCFLNVISNGMYQYKHDALFSFLNLSIKIVVVDVDDIIFDK